MYVCMFLIIKNLNVKKKKKKKKKKKFSFPEFVMFIKSSLKTFDCILAFYILF